MRILITNDDSISSSVLLPLAKWAQKHGEVTVVVPKYEQSGKSHGIELHKSFEVVKVPSFAPGIDAYTVDSTPADCVRFAIEGLKKEFDLVISGINKGLNIGRDIVYSGTVGAILESAYQGIAASVAISTEPASFEPALAQLDRVYDFFIEHDLLSKNHIYNVNIPLKCNGIRITRMGGPYFGDDFEEREPNMYLPIGKPIFEASGDEEIDTDAVLVYNYISITPLEVDRTQKTVFDELKKLNKN